MTGFASCIYEGVVVHKRLTPRQHRFAYRVFTLCLDVDEIDRLDRSLRLFSRSKRNLLSISDAELGAPGEGSVGDKARRLLASAGLSRFSTRIELVCYPRLLGYVFNPLSVYFCRDDSDHVGVVIYEVTNTFGERKSYVIPASKGGGGTIAQDCAKEMYVSPFTGASGSYGFHGIAPSDRIVVGVNFREASRPVLKTHFRGERLPLTDATIARLVARYPLMTLKVIGAIHLEAARLWAKGVPVVMRHTSPPYSFAIVDRLLREPHHG
jgi:DUF1365 family protein